MFTDFLTIFTWWALLFALGAIFFPLTSLVFKNFFDQGYAFSKTIAILSISYVVWLLGSLKLLPFTTEIVFLATGLFTLLNFIISQKFTKSLKPNWKIILFEEVLFFLALGTWSFIRGFQPDIRGLEKFMDFGFVNSILRSDYFPPQDMWFTGESINYYYFGHLTAAVLTRLSGIPSHITYNLMIATIFSLSITNTFSLAANFLYTTGIKKYRPLIAVGLLSSFLLNLGGNLHPLYWWLTKKSFLNYWYPDATRFIVKLFGATDNTIHEFPIYSFVVADLHGHLLNLPSVLLFLAIAFTMVWQKKASLLHCLMVSWLLGIFYMTNAWDFPIYFLVFGLVILYLNWTQNGLHLKTIVKTVATSTLVILVGGLITSLPFHLSFQNISKGVALVDFHSPLRMLLVLWGLPLVATIIFVLFLFLNKTKKFKITNKQRDTDFFVLILLLVSWLLIIIPEIIYVKDIYIHEYQRANTMFKFTYQSFVMFSLTIGYIVARIATNEKLKSKRNLRVLQFILLAPLLFLLMFVSIYPYFAVRSYYGLQNYMGLSGETWLKNEYKGEYEAIQWLRMNVTNPSTILEAVGDSYTDNNVVSSYTGLPTVEGWLVHEWLWRGSYDEPGKRASDVEKIYTSSNIQEVSNLVKKYSIKFIVVGTLEKRKYPNLREENIKALGEPVFSSGPTKIYSVNY